MLAERHPALPAAPGGVATRDRLAPEREHHPPDATRPSAAISPSTASSRPASRPSSWPSEPARSKDLHWARKAHGGSPGHAVSARPFNLEGRELARGRVGVIGGGNSAVDAARVALRQKDVESVTILYRRDRRTRCPPSPRRSQAASRGRRQSRAPGLPRQDRWRRMVAWQARSASGTGPASGRPADAENRRLYPGPNSTFRLDTLIVAVGEEGGTGIFVRHGNRDQCGGAYPGRSGDSPDQPAGSLRRRRRWRPDPTRWSEAIAAGKKAALMIDRYLQGEELKQPVEGSAPGILPPVRPGQRKGEGTGQEGQGPASSARFAGPELRRGRDAAFCRGSQAGGEAVPALRPGIHGTARGEQIKFCWTQINADKEIPFKLTF